MTFKNAMADLPFGGGKSVLAVPAIPQGDARTELLLRYADFVASLGGSYVTACDMNTTEADMDVVGERCPHVMGRSVAAGGSGTSAPDTAIGVFHGIRAEPRACVRVGRSVGQDDRGRRARARSVDRSAICWPRPARSSWCPTSIADRAKAVAERVGADDRGSRRTRSTPPCDLFSPCATGAVLNADTIPRLRCRVVAGAANNQLAAPVDADRLAAAGILYAPDYVVNAGGVLHLAGYERLGWTPDEMATRLAGIGGHAHARCSPTADATASRPRRRRTGSRSTGSCRDRRLRKAGLGTLLAEARSRSARFLR